MRLRTQIILVTGLTLMIASALFGAATFRTKERALLSGMDDKLMATALLAKEILPADYHDKISGAGSVSDAEYLRIVDRWNRLCKQLGLEYIWSLMLIDGKTVFTSASSTSKDANNQDHARFFEAHSNPEFYEAALLTLTPQHRIIDDKWGRIKVVLLPFKNAGGHPYLFGASMKMAEVESLTKKTIRQSLLISLGVFLLGIALNVVFAGSLVRPLETMTNLAKSIGEGNWGHIVETSGASEIRSLGHTLNEMSQSLRDKINEIMLSGDTVRQEQEFSHTLLDTIADGVVACDRKGALALFNRTAREWHGMDAWALPSEEWSHHYNLCGPDGATPLPTESVPLVRALRGETVRDTEMTIVPKGQPPRHILANGSPFFDARHNLLGAVVVMRDITEQKRAVEALRKSEVLNRRLVENLPHRVFIKDRDSAYVSCNVNYARDLGVTPEQIVGKDDFALHPAEMAEAFRADDRAIIETGELKELDERFLVEGQERWAHTMKVPFRDEQGIIMGVLGVFEDITDRRRAEEELLKMQKLQSVGTLAGGIAHDFNNILLGLFGNISLAKEELAKDHPGRALLDEAEKSMSRAVRLTKQLLTFAQGGAPVKEDVCLGALIEEVARFDLSGSTVRLLFQQVADPWQTEVDKGQIQQVISNLVINARQAMPEGGCLHIILENADLPEEAVPSLCRGSYVKVTVRDEGSGIDPKHLSRIFDPYFTTKHSGSGLGLATVWSIISKHSGHIGVASELGKGTAFTFYLPASHSQHPTNNLPLSSVCPPPARAAKILVMDDEEMVCGLVHKMLTRCGHAVTTAPDGQAAITLYQQAIAAGAPFDMVIMDLTIPGGIGGKEALKELLALDPNVRAIVSSGYADDPVMASPATYGFKGTVAKPYTAHALRDVVARALA
jgi:PAS domain S-box-containing protein